VADVCVAKNSSVVVSIDENAIFTVASGKDSLNYTVTNGGDTTYVAGDSVLAVTPEKGSDSATLTFPAPTTVTYAGNYTGTLTFVVSVVKD
jgi:hypothetical protein